MTRWTVRKAKTKDGVEIIWIEDENGTTVCDLYHRIIDTNDFYIKDGAEEHAPVVAAAPQMKDLIKKMIAATEGIFECGGIRSEAMELMKGIETDGT